MTRARSLKQTIRTRAAKTGERYTTARRHVLKTLAPTARPPADQSPDGTAAPPAARAAARRTTAPTTAASRPAATTATNLTKGAVSDAKVREKTGHGLDHWFDVLDRFGGVAKGHTALARHLHEGHGVDGWYAQGITVAYERARGVRALNQRVTGDYEVSVSKVIPVDTQTIVRAFTDARRRARWLAAANPELAAALDGALKAPASKSFVIREDGLGRFRYKWGTTTVQFYLTPRGEGRTSVVVTNMKLPDGTTLEARRLQWRAALGALARLSIE